MLQLWWTIFNLVCYLQEELLELVYPYQIEAYTLVPPRLETFRLGAPLNRNSPTDCTLCSQEPEGSLPPVMLNSGFYVYKVCNKVGAD